MRRNLDEVYDRKPCDGQPGRKSRVNTSRWFLRFERFCDECEPSGNHGFRQQPLHAVGGRRYADRDPHLDDNIYGNCDCSGRQCDCNGHSDGDCSGSCRGDLECKPRFSNSGRIFRADSLCHERDAGNVERVGRESLYIVLGGRDADCEPRWYDDVYRDCDERRG